MSGRKSRKGQKLASTRQSLNKRINMDTEEKKNDDRLPHSGKEDHECEKNETGKINENLPDSLFLQAGGAETSGTDQQMSSFEVSPYSQSQDCKDLLAHAEMANKKRKMGSTRKINRGFKAEGENEKEPQGKLEVSEEITEQHGVTEDVSVREEGSKEDCDHGSISKEDCDHGSIRHTEDASENKESHHLETTFQSQTMGMSCHNLDQPTKLSFNQESISHLLDCSLVTPVRSKQLDSLQMYHQVNVSHNTTDQKRKKDTPSRYFTGNEVEKNIANQYPCPTEHFCEVANQYGIVYFNEESKNAGGFVEDVQVIPSQSHVAMNTTLDQFKSDLMCENIGENERKSTSISHSYSSEVKGDKVTASLINEYEQQFSVASEKGFYSSRDASKVSQDTFTLANVGTTLGTVDEDLVSNCLKHDDTAKLTKDLESVYDFKNTECWERKKEYNDVSVVSCRIDSEVNEGVIEPLCPTQPTESDNILDKLSYELGFHCEPSVMEHKCHKDKQDDLSNARHIKEESSFNKNAAVGNQHKPNNEEDNHENHKIFEQVDPPENVFDINALSIGEEKEAKGTALASDDAFELSNNEKLTPIISNIIKPNYDFEVYITENIQRQGTYFEEHMRFESHGDQERQEAEIFQTLGIMAKDYEGAAGLIGHDYSGNENDSIPHQSEEQITIVDCIKVRAADFSNQNKNQNSLLIPEGNCSIYNVPSTEIEYVIDGNSLSQTGDNQVQIIRMWDRLGKDVETENTKTTRPDNKSSIKLFEDGKTEDIVSTTPECDTEEEAMAMNIKIYGGIDTSSTLLQDMEELQIDTEEIIVQKDKQVDNEKDVEPISLLGHLLNISPDLKSQEYKASECTEFVVVTKDADQILMSLENVVVEEENQLFEPKESISHTPIILFQDEKNIQMSTGGLIQKNSLVQPLERREGEIDNGHLYKEETDVPLVDRSILSSKKSEITEEENNEIMENIKSPSEPLITEEEEKLKDERLSASPVILADVIHQRDSDVLDEVSKVEEEIIEQHGQSVIDDVQDYEITSSNKQKIGSVIIDIQNNFTDDVSPQEESKTDEVCDSQSTENASCKQGDGSPTCTTVKDISEIQVSLITPVNEEITYQVSSDKVRQLPWDRNLSEDHLEHETSRELKTESPENTYKVINIQDINNTPDNETEVLKMQNNSGEMGEAELKKMEPALERQKNGEHKSLEDPLHSPPDTKSGEQEPSESEEIFTITSKTDHTFVEQTKVEDVNQFTEVRDTISHLPSIPFQEESNIQMITAGHIQDMVSVQPLERREGEKDNGHLYKEETDVPLVDRSILSSKKSEITEEENNEIKENIKSPSEPLITEEEEKLKDERLNASPIILADVIHQRDSDVLDEVSKVEGEIIEQHGQSVIDDVQDYEITSSNKQKIGPVIIDIQNDFTDHVSPQEGSKTAEVCDSESTDIGNCKQGDGSPTCATVEDISEIQGSIITPVNEEITYEVSSDQVGQLPLDQNLSEDHLEQETSRELETESPDNTYKVIHIQDINNTPDNETEVLKMQNNSGEMGEAELKKTKPALERHKNAEHKSLEDPLHSPPDTKSGEQEPSESEEIFTIASKTDHTLTFIEQTKVEDVNQFTEVRDTISHLPSIPFQEESNIQRITAGHIQDMVSVQPLERREGEKDNGHLYKEETDVPLVDRSILSSKKSEITEEENNEIKENIKSPSEPLITEEEEKLKDERLNASPIILADVIHQRDSDVLDEVSKVEGEIIEQHGQSVIDDVQDYEITSSNKQKIGTVIIDIQNDFTDDVSPQEGSKTAEVCDSESTEIGNCKQGDGSPTCATVEDISEIQGSIITPVNEEITYEVSSDQVRRLPWDRNLAEDLLEHETSRELETESPDNTYKVIHIQDINNTPDNETEVLKMQNNSGEMGEAELKKMEPALERQKNGEHKSLEDPLNSPPDTKSGEQEPSESEEIFTITSKTDHTLTFVEQTKVEDVNQFTEVRDTISHLPSISFQEESNIQMITAGHIQDMVFVQPLERREGEKDNGHLYKEETDVPLVDRSILSSKKSEITEEENNEIKENIKSPSEPLITEEEEKLKDGRLNASPVILADVIHQRDSDVLDEVSKVEGEIIEQHGQSVIDDVQDYEITSSNKQKIGPVIIDIQNNFTDHVSPQEGSKTAEVCDSESTDIGNCKQGDGSPTCATVEDISEIQGSIITPVNEEITYEVSSDQVGQLPLDQNLSEDHLEQETSRELETESPDNTYKVIHIQDINNTPDNETEVLKMQNNSGEMGEAELKKTKPALERHKNAEHKSLEDPLHSPPDTKSGEQEPSESEEIFTITSKTDHTLTFVEQTKVEDVNQFTEVRDTISHLPSIPFQEESNIQMITAGHIQDMVSVQPLERRQGEKDDGHLYKEETDVPLVDRSILSSKKSEITEEENNEIKENIKSPSEPLITEEEEKLKDGRLNASPVILADVIHQRDSDVLDEVSKVEGEIIEQHGQSVIDDVQDYEITSSDKQKIGPVIIDIQNNFTDHVSPQEGSKTAEVCDLESTDIGNCKQGDGSPTCATVEDISEIQGSIITPVNEEITYEVSSDQVGQLPLDQNLSEDHLEQETSRELETESPDNTYKVIHIQDINNTPDNETEVLKMQNNSGEMREAELKKMEPALERQKNGEHKSLEDPLNSPPDTKSGEQEPSESEEIFTITSKTDHTLTFVEQTKVEDVNQFTEVRDTISHLPSIAFQEESNIQMITAGHIQDMVSVQPLERRQGEKDNGHLYKEETDVPLVDRSILSSKKSEITEEENNEIKENIKSPSEPLITEEEEKLKDERLNASPVILADVIHQRDSDVLDEVSKVEGEIIEQHGQSVIDDVQDYEITSSNKQKIGTVIIDIHNDFTDDVSPQEESKTAEVCDSESTEIGNCKQGDGSPTCATVEDISEIQGSIITPVNEEITYEVSSDQVGQLPLDQNLSEDHLEQETSRELETESPDNTYKVIHIQDINNTPDNETEVLKMQNNSGEMGEAELKKTKPALERHKNAEHKSLEDPLHSPPDTKSGEQEPSESEEIFTITSKTDHTLTFVEQTKMEDVNQFTEVRDTISHLPSIPFQEESNIQMITAGHIQDMVSVQPLERREGEKDNGHLYKEETDVPLVDRSILSSKKSEITEEENNEIKENIKSPSEPLITEEEEKLKDERLNASPVILADVIHQRDSDVLDEVSKVEGEIIEQHGQSVIDDVQDYEITSSNKQKIGPVIIDIQNNFTDHVSPQEGSKTAEVCDSESTDIGNCKQGDSSPTCATVEDISEIQGSIITPVNEEITYEVSSDQVGQLPLDKNLSEDHLEQETSRELETESPDNTYKVIHIQDINNTPDNETEVLKMQNNSGEMGEAELKKTKPALERHKNAEHKSLEDPLHSPPDTKSGEQEPSESEEIFTITSKTDHTLTFIEQTKVEDVNQFTEVRDTISHLPSIPFQEESNIQMITAGHIQDMVSVQPLERREGEKDDGHLYKEETDVPLVDRSILSSKKSEITEEENNEIKENIKSPSEPLITEEEEKLKDERLNASPVILADVIHQRDSDVLDEVSKVEGEIIKQHGQSVIDDVQDYEITSSNKQKIGPVIIDIQNDFTDYVSPQVEYKTDEVCYSESTENASCKQGDASPTCATVEDISEIQVSLMTPVNEEITYEVSSDQVGQLPLDQNLSEDHLEQETSRELETESPENTYKVIHIQDINNTPDNETEVLKMQNNSGEMGEAELKKMEPALERQKNSEHKSLEDPLHSPPDTKSGEQEPSESEETFTITSKTDHTLTFVEQTKVEDVNQFTEVRDTISHLPSISFQEESNIQMITAGHIQDMVSVQPLERREGEKDDGHLYKEETDVPLVDRSILSSKKSEITEEENKDIKEKIKSPSEHLITEEEEKLKDGRLNASPESIYSEIHLKISKTMQDEVIAEKSDSEKRRKIGSTRRSLRGQLPESHQKFTLKEIKVTENIKQQKIEQCTSPGETGGNYLEATTHVFTPAFSNESSTQSPDVPSKHPEPHGTEKLDNNVMEVMETMKDMDPKDDEDIAREETKSAINDAIVSAVSGLHVTACGYSEVVAAEQDDKPQIYDKPDKLEGSLLSEIEYELKKSSHSHSPQNAEALGELGIPDPAFEQRQSTLEVPSSLGILSQTCTESASPGRRRKMGSTRKPSRNKHTEETSDDKSDQEVGNLEKNKLEKSGEFKKETETPKNNVKEQIISEVTKAPAENILVLTDDLPVCKPYLISEPGILPISNPGSGHSEMETSPSNEQGIKQFVKEIDVSTEDSLVSLDDIRMSALYDGSSGKRVKIDLEGWNEQGPDFGVAVYNVVMVGNCNVGKTSFIKRLQNGHFSPEYYSTIGVDTFIQTITVGNRTIKLNVWDTAGQERYHSITTQVFHKAQGLLLMYDIASSQSFIAVRDWISQVQERAPSDVIIMLLGNKKDCAERKVQLQEGEALSREYNIHFMECSAATGENVLESMKTLAWLLVKQRVRKEEEQTILQLKQPQKKSGCC